MSSKQHDPNKITVYPDHSTLCASFKAHRAQADSARYSAYLPLRDWFERVAREANLCLSTTHLVELFRWDDAATADEMARWYDRLPIVWTASMFDDVQEFEGERWTKIAAGVGVAPAARPFAASLLTAFRALTPNEAAVLLAEKEPALALVTVMRESSRWRQTFEAYGEQFLAMLVNVVENHRWADEQGWSDDRKRRETEYNVGVALRTFAQDADKRLTGRGDAEYARKQCTAGDVQDLLVALYDKEPGAMPLFRVTRSFCEGAIARMERGQVVDGQPSSRLRQALLSSFGDWMHLVGAAYCDVFTCDGTVSQWLGGLRPTIGLRPQLAARGYAGGADAFVRDLMATWP